MLVSVSTTYQHQEPALQRAADALGELPVRGLITLGGVLAPEVLSAPENVRVRRYVSHAAVLPQVAVVLCHAGLWTLMAALRHGVPLVCLPIAATGAAARAADELESLVRAGG